jgi:Dicarboxylate transport
MSEAADELLEAPEDQAPPPRRKRRWRVLAILLVVVIAGVWLARERIANKIIAGQLESYDLPATYDLEKVSATRQVLSNVVIGDPKHPDMTIDRVEIETVPTFGLPTIGEVVLVRPRLYGTYKQAKASFGTLDKLIFADSERPPGLPDLNLVLSDGRARLDSDFGLVGIMAQGKGNLRDGFAGTLAAVAPTLEGGGCQTGKTTLYGKLASKDARLGFSGPLRLAALVCREQSLAVKDAAVQFDLKASEAFDAVDGTYALTSNALGWQGTRLARLGGKGQFTFKAGDLTADYAFAGQGLAAGWADAAGLSAEGMVRSHDKLARFETEGTLEGSAVRPGRDLDALLAQTAKSAEGTLLAPLAAQIRQGLAREGAASRMEAGYTLRQTGEITSLTVPRAVLRGSSGAQILELSRALVTLGGTGGPRLVGHVRTGGAGLPVIAGLVEKRGSGAEARLAMREYSAGETRIALPELRLVQERGGAVGFAGRATLSGVLPGGRVENLVLPLEGTWSERRGLAVWRRCTPVRFDRFAIANLKLDARAVTLCPGSGGAILASDGRGTRLSAGTAGLDLAGTLGSTPIRLSSGALGFAWPGSLAARDILVSLGKPTEPSTLRLGEVKARLGREIEGTFAGTEVKLAPVPLDVLEAKGNWHYAGSRLTVSEGAFVLKDRERDARFYPLVARDASLKLKGSEFLAEALLREPKSDREIVRTSIAHDLDTGRGGADLLVPGIVFDRRLQPDTLTYLAQGVIALAKGTVTGEGRIDWVDSAVTSTGRFATEKLDFAAAFGPVKGASGTVRFTDLLGLVTAPDQRLKLAAINPGIEVNDGEVSFQLEPGRVLMVNGANWPFIDGTLELLPTRMVLGASEVRRYTLKLEGANAARFIAQLELGNLAATGVFDGTMPLVFDENGGRIEGGLLISRPPGGNVSYVGELTYKDMGTMANFAFQTLRSIDYRKMEIGMDGALDGEIVTKLRFDGVRQGAGAKRSIVTRSLAGLPIQFNVNIRAPFQRLVSSFKALYDPAYIRDPRELGLVDKDGKPPPAPDPAPPPTPALPGNVQPIQPPDSRDKP